VNFPDRLTTFQPLSFNRLSAWTEVGEGECLRSADGPERPTGYRCNRGSTRARTSTYGRARVNREVRPDRPQGRATSLPLACNWLGCFEKTVIVQSDPRSLIRYFGTVPRTCAVKPAEVAVELADRSMVEAILTWRPAIGSLGQEISIRHGHARS